MAASFIVIILSSILLVPLSRYLDKIQPSKKEEEIPLSNPVKTTNLVIVVAIPLSIISSYLIVQEPRIVAAIGLMILMLTAATIITGTMIIIAAIMAMKNPAKMERLKRKKNILSSIIKFNT
ncbi:MAG: hypothetical protein MCSN_6020 [Candidatus Microsyncoccus archaeolyticus]|jgi:hypothetical protein|nr:MAG: hypothetical protein MCSN_6020 [Candidatus Parcubacteria bacterium]